VKPRNIELPATVCHALDELSRQTEPGRTALDILDRGWRGSGPANVPIFNQAEAKQLAAALTEVSRGKASKRTRSSAESLAWSLRHPEEEADHVRR
jgi:hypothetical protein